MISKNIHTIPILIEYSEKDCKKGRKWLVKDVAKEVAKRLKPKIKVKPNKATIVVIYNSVFEELVNDFNRMRRQRKKQDKG